MRITLTQKLIEAAASKDKKQADYFDVLTPGLALRVTQEGKKTWTFVFTIPLTKKRARMTLGTFPALPLIDARVKANDARGLVEKNKDPRDQAPKTIEKTMAQIIEDRLEMEVRGKLRTADEAERRYQKDVIPLVGELPVKDFRMTHLNLIIDPILRRGSTRAAGMVFQDLRALFNFAIRRGEIDHSPIAKAQIPMGSTPRTRFLTTDEIKVVWSLLPSALAKSDYIPTILKLCLVTGQRLSEVAGIKREEIDMGKRLWTIPQERVKNMESHEVPLSNLAISLFNEAMRATNGAFLFPNDSGEEALPHYAIDRTISRAQMARPEQMLGKFGIPVWKPHDLRRTVATQMSLEENGLHIPDFIISKVLNHRSATAQSITHRVYIQNSYLKEKRDALEKWGNFLVNLVGVDEQQQEAA